MPYHSSGGKMHMSSYGSKAAPTGKNQIGATDTFHGKPHGSDAMPPAKKGSAPSKLTGDHGQMSVRGGGQGPKKGGGSGPSGDSRNFSTGKDAGWGGPKSTLKAGMRSAITERQRR